MYKDRRSSEFLTKPVGSQVSIQKSLHDPGSLASPTISFTTDPATGWFSAGKGSVGFVASGVVNIIQDKSYTEFGCPIVLNECESEITVGQSKGVIYKKVADDSLWWETANGEFNITGSISAITTDIEQLKAVVNIEQLKASLASAEQLKAALASAEQLKAALASAEQLKADAANAPPTVRLEEKVNMLFEKTNNVAETIVSVGSVVSKLSVNATNYNATHDAAIMQLNNKSQATDKEILDINIKLDLLRDKINHAIDNVTSWVEQNNNLTEINKLIAGWQTSIGKLQDSDTTQASLINLLQTSDATQASLINLLQDNDVEQKAAIGKLQDNDVEQKAAIGKLQDNDASFIEDLQQSKVSINKSIEKINQDVLVSYTALNKMTDDVMQMKAQVGQISGAYSGLSNVVNELGERVNKSQIGELLDELVISNENLVSQIRTLEFKQNILDIGHNTVDIKQNEMCNKLTALDDQVKQLAKYDYLTELQLQILKVESNMQQYDLQVEERLKTLVDSRVNGLVSDHSNQLEQIANQSNGVDIDLINGQVVDLVKKVSEVTMQIDKNTTTIDNLSATVNELSSSASSQFAACDFKLIGLESLTVGLNHTTTKLTTDLNVVSERLTTELNNTTTKLTTELNETTAKLTNELNNVSERLTTDLNETTTKLTADFTLLSNSMVEQIFAFSERLDAEHDLLNNYRIDTDKKLELIQYDQAASYRMLDTKLTNIADRVDADCKVLIDNWSNTQLMTQTTQLMTQTTQQDLIAVKQELLNTQLATQTAQQDIIRAQDTMQNIQNILSNTTQELHFTNGKIEAQKLNYESLTECVELANGKITNLTIQTTQLSEKIEQQTNQLIAQTTQLGEKIEQQTIQLIAQTTQTTEKIEQQANQLIAQTTQLDEKITQLAAQTEQQANQLIAQTTQTTELNNDVTQIKWAIAESVSSFDTKLQQVKNDIDNSIVCCSDGDLSVGDLVGFSPVAADAPDINKVEKVVGCQWSDVTKVQHSGKILAASYSENITIMIVQQGDNVALQYTIKPSNQVTIPNQTNQVNNLVLAMANATAAKIIPLQSSYLVSYCQDSTVFIFHMQLEPSLKTISRLVYQAKHPIIHYDCAYENSGEFDLLLVAMYNNTNNYEIFLCSVSPTITLGYSACNVVQEMSIGNADFHDKYMSVLLIPGQLSAVLSCGNYKTVVQLPTIATDNCIIGETLVDTDSCDCVKLQYDSNNGVIISVEKTITNNSFLQILDTFGSKLIIQNTKKLQHITAVPLSLVYCARRDVFVVFYLDAVNSLSAQLLSFDGESITLGCCYKSSAIVESDSSVYCIGGLFTVVEQRDTELSYNVFNTVVGIMPEAHIGLVSKIVEYSVGNINNVLSIENYRKTYVVKIKGQIYNLANFPKSYVGKKIYYNGRLTNVATGAVFVGTALSTSKLLIGW